VAHDRGAVHGCAAAQMRGAVFTLGTMVTARITAWTQRSK
jgi:hypothetical protein